MKKYAVPLVCAAVSLFVYGCAYSSSPNTAQIIPFIKKLMNPSLYPGDFYIASQSAFPSLYPLLMARLAAFFPLESLHFWLYAALKIWFMRLIYLLAMEISGREDAAVLSCLLCALSPITNVFSLMGEDPLMKAAMFQTSFSAPLAALSLIYFLRRGYMRAFALVWAVYFINGLTANFLLVMYAAAFVAVKENRRAMLRAGAGFAGLMAVWAVWYLRLKNPFGHAGPEFAAILKLWYPGHYFPSQWEMSKWRNVAVFLPLLAYLYIRGMGGCRRAAEAKAFLFAFAAMWAAALFFSEIFPVRQMLVLQFFRSDSLFAPLAMVFAAVFIADSGGLRGAASSALLCLALLEFSNPLAGQIAGAAFLALRALPCAPQPAPDSRLKYVLPAALVAVLFVPFMLERVLYFGLDFKDAGDRAWIETQLWAKQNTPPETVFLTPPDMRGWRVFSERSPVTEWLDGAAMHWAPGAERIWFSRERDSNSGQDRRLLCRKYGARYIVAHSREKTADSGVPRAGCGKLVYENSGFAVCEI
ncbi:MAG: DUF6798 domain-containing protein [Elusimicrobiales bacterium]